MPVAEIQQPGRNIKEKALLASALLEADMPSVQVAKAVGISKRTTARLKASQREGKVLEHIDPNAVQRIRATFQDKCLPGSLTNLDGPLVKLKPRSQSGERASSVKRDGGVREARNVWQKGNQT